MELMVHSIQVVDNHHEEDSQEEGSLHDESNLHEEDSQKEDSLQEEVDTQKEGSLHDLEEEDMQLVGSHLEDMVVEDMNRMEDSDHIHHQLN